MKLKLPESSRNWLSLVGATISIISFSMIVFLFVISSFSGKGNTYLGLVIYMVLPIVLVIGLLLIPLGMFLKRRREKRTGKRDEKEWPIFDFNEVKNRNAFMIFAIGTSIFLFATALGSYEAFTFTESVEFCGKLCHEVMKPEYAAYQGSPHARVRCVDCHVGSGADWYVRSKLSGLYQVYAVTLGTVPRPIETPIVNLRPARETCEECHWPQKFYARKLVTQKHFLSDEKNSEWDITLTMKIGAPLSALGLQEGIHWHINQNIRIEYKALDKKREKVPWVKYTNLKTNESFIYQDKNVKLSEDVLAKLETREMDCMDCHNRPSHNYQPPAFFVNNAIIAGDIPKELPRIKAAALDILRDHFKTTDDAMKSISERIQSFYKDNYPEIYSTKKELIQKAIAGIQKEFNRNIFPEMKVRWDVYPNNIGHLEFIGCFRCHNDNHSTDRGRLIKRDCTICHSINAQGPPEKLEVAQFNTSLQFKHPGSEVGDLWKTMLCVECHTGLNP
jgi:nitrate/TMAO reductase-like tetraheme cytochrome c subunit